MLSFNKNKLHKFGKQGLKLGLTTLLCVSLVFSTSFVSINKTSALADNVSSAQSELDSGKAKLADVQAEYNKAQAEAQNLQSEISSITIKAFEAQEKMLEKQSSLNSIATSEYKNGSALPFLDVLLTANSFDDFVKKLDYCNKAMNAKVQAIHDQKEAKEEFDSILAELNEKSDSMNAAISAAAAKKSEAESLVSEASSKLSAAEAEQLKNQQQSVKPTPSPSPTPGPDTGDWKSGTASAYNTGRTATGAPVTESSMGISIPMSWPNYRQYFGHTVQIKIGGMTVIGVVNDCGGLDGGARCMDVQPGIYHAFGYGSAEAWGLRNVSYKIL